MSLAALDVTHLTEELRAAARVELPKMRALRQRARQLAVVDLGYRQCLAVAPVATDGGENRLSFEPLNIEIIRVADSEGREHLQKCVPLGADPAIVARLFEEIPLLGRFLDRLGLPYSQLSYFLPGEARPAAEASAGGPRSEEDVRRFVRTFRDIAEWAVLLELASSTPGVRMLVIRDGLLRSIHLTPRAMRALERAFQRAYEATGALLVGVAKRSKLLSYLSVSLALEGSLGRVPPCFCEIPEGMEAECYQSGAAWMHPQGFGRMHLAKLAEGLETPVFPVDLPPWLLSRRKEVLEYLAETARASFPLLGYPQPLVRAHESANLRGLEMSVLSDLLIRVVTEQMAEADAEPVVRHVLLRRGLTLGGASQDG